MCQFKKYHNILKVACHRANQINAPSNVHFNVPASPINGTRTFAVARPATLYCG